MSYVITAEMRIDREPIPLPPKRRRVVYRFDQIPVGGSAVFNRGLRTIRNRLGEYKRLPENRGQLFKLAEISPIRTRVWRVK